MLINKLLNSDIPIMPFSQLPDSVETLQYSDYIVDPTRLCEGGYGTIFKAERRAKSKASHTTAAMKFFGYVSDKAHNRASAPKNDDIYKEISLLSRLKGLSGVSEMYGVTYDSAEGLLPTKNPRFREPFPIIVMELIKGGDLFERITKTLNVPGSTRRVSITEKSLSKMFKSFVVALDGIHNRNFIHCDIKMENIMLLSDDSNNNQVKIVDFGIMKEVDPVTKVCTTSKGYFGTDGFFAPESIAFQEYSVKSDVWQSGCVLYTMLTGSYLPQVITDLIDKSNPGKVKQLHNLSKEEYNKILFSVSEFEIISKSGRDLLEGMLERDPKRRWSIDMILSHSWLNGSAPSNILSISYSDKIRKLALRRRLKKEFENRANLMTLAAIDLRVSDEEREVNVATDMFNQIDEDKNGIINLEELVNGLKNIINITSVSQEDIEAVFDAIDLNGDGEIDVVEFQEFYRVIIASTTLATTMEQNKEAVAAAKQQEFAVSDEAGTDFSTGTKISSAKWLNFMFFISLVSVFTSLYFNYRGVSVLMTALLGYIIILQSQSGPSSKPASSPSDTNMQPTNGAIPKVMPRRHSSAKRVRKEN